MHPLHREMSQMRRNTHQSQSSTFYAGNFFRISKITRNKCSHMNALDNGEHARASLEILWNKEILEPINPVQSRKQGQAVKWPAIDW